MESKSGRSHKSLSLLEALVVDVHNSPCFSLDRFTLNDSVSIFQWRLGLWLLLHSEDQSRKQPAETNDDTNAEIEILMNTNTTSNLCRKI